MTVVWKVVPARLSEMWPGHIKFGVVTDTIMALPQNEEVKGGLGKQ